MIDLVLFDMPGGVPVEVERLSADRRRTARNQARIDAGFHPATHLPLRAEGGTCGDCAHIHRYHYHTRWYIKCDRHVLGESHSAASDVRVGWLACTAFEERTP